MRRAHAVLGIGQVGGELEPAARTGRAPGPTATTERSIAATRSAAMGNVRTIAADTTAAIVERLIGKAPAKQEVAAALGQVIKQ